MVATPGLTGYAENDWVGRQLAIGDQVRGRVTGQLISERLAYAARAIAISASSGQDGSGFRSPVTAKPRW